MPQWRNRQRSRLVIGRLVGSSPLWGFYSSPFDMVRAICAMCMRTKTLDWLIGYAKLNFSVTSPGGVGEWLIPPDCKSGARKGYVGSNPTPSTI